MPASSPELTPATGRGSPLQGVCVLDLTRLLPGPMATLHLGDLGADVIKVEDTGLGDYAAESVRTLVNRNKRAIRIDLKQASGVAVLLRLCEQADVLVESFRPGVMQRLGVGYEAVAQRNPKIVYCSLSGYGQTGPYQGAPGHDLNYSGWAGVADQIGALGQAPALSNVPVADLLGGSMTAVMGILSALFDAGRSGLGRHVDIAIADGVLAHAVIPLAALNSQGQTQPAGASKLTGLLPCYSVYETADGRHLALAALEKKFWDAFCAVIGREDLKPLHYPLDEAQSTWVRGELRTLIGAHDLAWWMKTLEGTDCCATPILKLEETLSNEQFVARGMVLPLVQVQGKGGDSQGRQFACPVKMSGFDFAVRHVAPRQGEHTDAVLQAAGFSDAEVQSLRRQGAID